MLELRDVSLFIQHDEDVRPLLSDLSTHFPEKHFAAIIGPSGCGKSTLLKTILGVATGEEEGDILWHGRNLAEEDFEPSEIGYVPQFSIAHEELTAEECVANAAKLRIRGIRGTALDEKVQNTLKEVGLADFATHRVQVLSGGQKRRLALAMEIVSAPTMLLCDEVTSGLDAQSEDGIVELMHALSRDNRIVLSVTHSLRHIDLYDSVMVLYQGVLAYHGPPEFLTHYFRVESVETLYAQLELREAKAWSQSWRKHRAAFESAIESGVEEEMADIHFENLDDDDFASERDALDASQSTPEESKGDDSEDAKKPPAATRGPGLLSQFFTLLNRRFVIFSRSRAQLFLQLGLILGFPILVAIFAWNGLPNVKNLSMGMDLDMVQQLVEAKDFLVQASKIGSLVSGIVMFQVILLTLMGANNSGREIAAERLIFEKEKLAGVSPLAYVASKVAFLALFVVCQSVWMGAFVHFVCGFPGDLGAQLLFLILVNAAMTAICLAVSSFMDSPEQASLVSIYLVGFQLPLSGAVLALPEFIGALTRPFIAAYWSWSGILQTLKGERYYDIVQTVIQTQLSPTALCLWVLGFHVVLGIVLAWIGCQRTRLN